MTRSSAATVLVLASVALSCAVPRLAMRPAPAWAARLPADFPLEGQLTVRVDGGDEPPLALRFPWANAGSVLGWGGAHLWARPGADHVSVTALIDAPSEHSRWADCEAMHVVADGVEMEIQARYIGRPEAGRDFVYEAVRVSLSVDQLAAMADARELRAEVCGDEMAVSAAHRHAMGRFVQWFHNMAVPDHPPDLPYYRALGATPELLPLEQEEPLTPTHG